MLGQMLKFILMMTTVGYSNQTSCKRKVVLKPLCFSSSTVWHLQDRNKSKLTAILGCNTWTKALHTKFLINKLQSWIWLSTKFIMSQFNEFLLNSSTIQQLKPNLDSHSHTFRKVLLTPARIQLSTFWSSARDSYILIKMTWKSQCELVYNRFSP